MTAAGDVLLAGATLLLLGGVAAGTLHLRVAAPPLRRAWLLLTLAGFGLLGVATLLLIVLLLVSDLSVEYVHSYSFTAYPWWYKLAGLWAAQKGSVILWATFAAVVVGIAAVRARRAGDRGPFNAILVLTGTSFVAALTMLAWFDSTFAPTEPYLLTFLPRGNGLAPVLETPFMLIHPPLQFVAYALTTVLFGAGVAALWTGEKGWGPPLMPWVRAAWLFSAVGLGLGGLWAYYVLNFGGFWAWDPVETANLLPWLAVTALLHVLNANKRAGSFQRLAPVLACMPLLLTLFATFATRSGLWTSVHAFTDPSREFNPDPAGRMLGIMEISLPPRFFFALGIVALLGVSALAARRMALDLAPDESMDDPAQRATARVARGWTVLAAGVLPFAALDPVGFASATLELFALAGAAGAAGGFVVLLLLLPILTIGSRR